eukprot:899210-Pleurochrysis_carterae.AAC.1
MSTSSPLQLRHDKQERGGHVLRDGGHVLRDGKGEAKNDLPMPRRAFMSPANGERADRAEKTDKMQTEKTDKAEKMDRQELISRVMADEREVRGALSNGKRTLNDEDAGRFSKDGREPNDGGAGRFGDVESALIDGDTGRSWACAVAFLCWE